MTRPSRQCPIVALLVAACGFAAVCVSLTSHAAAIAAPLPVSVEGRGEIVVNGEHSANVAPILVGDNVVPGWSGSAWLDVDNAGAAPGRLRFSVQEVVNQDFGCAEPEKVCQGGELGQNVLLVLREGESTVWCGPATVEATADAGWVDLGTLDAGASRRFQLTAEIPGSVGNEIMSDQVTFNVVFLLEAIEPTPGPNNPSTDGGATPSTEVLAPPAPTPSYTSEVLAPLLPNSGGIPLASLGLLAALGLLFTAVGIRLGR